MVGSTIAISIAVAMVGIVIRSVEQSQDLERSTQVFFAIESGLEAGFFHHNARGQGVKFLDLNDASFPVEQTISHSVTTLDSRWTIDGRATSPILEGLVYENTPLQLRWFWDNSTKVTDSPNIIDNAPNFQLEFDPYNELPAGFDFNTSSNEVLLSWLLTKAESAAGIRSLAPLASDPESPCTLPSSFICRDQLTSITFSSTDSSRIGTLLPRNTGTTDNIDNFITNPVGNSTFQLVITPILKFQDSISGVKIAGIPFKITNSLALPRPDYSIFTSVSAGDFSKDLNILNIPERTSIQAFSYVIFE